MITTTLKALRQHGACVSGYNKVVSNLKGVQFDPERDSYIRFAHKDPITLLSILETNGLYDALWALRASNATDRDCRLFAVACARHVCNSNTDDRVRECIDVAERFANGSADQDVLSAARDAAWAAARDAAGAAAWAAARAAVRAAAGAAAWAAARDAEMSFQEELFVQMCNGTSTWQKGD